MNLDIPIIDKLTKTITSTRIILRLPETFDLNDYHLCFKDQDAMKYYKDGFSATPSETKKKLTQSINHWKRHNFGDWAILDKVTHEFIGFCGFDCEIIPGTPNLGFALLKTCWHKGFATEAALAAIHYGVEELKFDKITAFVHLENKGSIAVLNKCHMRFYNKVINKDYRRIQYTFEYKDYVIKTTKMK